MTEKRRQRKESKERQRKGLKRNRIPENVLTVKKVRFPRHLVRGESNSKGRGVKFGGTKEISFGMLPEVQFMMEYKICEYFAKKERKKDSTDEF